VSSYPPIDPTRELKEKLQNWLIELISHFREELEKLPYDKRKIASLGLEDLSEICQLVVIWAKDPEFQIIIITHSNSLEDKLIEIYGPVENNKLVGLIEYDVLKSPIIEVVGREKVEDALIYDLRLIQYYLNPLISIPKPFFLNKHSVSDSPYAVSWIVVGNLLDLNSKELAKIFVNNIKSSLESTPSPQSPQEDKLILEGFGTYVYPHIWIGDIPKPKSFREKVFGMPLWISATEKIIIETYKKRPVVITRDGFIAIGEKDKWKALELLNELVSVLLLRGIPCNVVREVDLEEAKITENSLQRAWSPLSGRTLLPQRLFIDYFSPFSSYSTLYFASLPLKSVKEEDMRKVIKLAELLTIDDRMNTLLLLYLEAFTYFLNTEYKQSLIMGWIIIEDYYIKDLWLEHTSKIPNEKRVSKLASWTVDARLEVLNISHILTDEEYSLLMEIKDVRNEVVHEGKLPTKEIVERCLNLVSKIIQKYIGDYIASKFHEL